MFRNYLIAVLLIAIVCAPPVRAEVVQAGLSLGYRVDELRWSVAADPTGTLTPNILSELTWTDVKSLYVRYDGHVRSASGWQGRWNLGYGFILEGDNQDSDYFGNNRTFEFSRSNNDADKGSVADFDFGFGYTFVHNQLGITPLVGYSQYMQKLRMRSGNQTIATPGFTPPLGPFDGLNSFYKTQWRGPWLALEFTYMLAPDSELLLRGAGHWPKYSAEANWNLRDDFQHPKSFEQDSEGEGHTLVLGWRYQINRDYWSSLMFEIGRWKTDPGTDRTFFTSGAIAETRLNEVEWNTKSVNLGVWIKY